MTETSTMEALCLVPTQEGQNQQLSSREKMAPGMLCSSCYCWLMGIWEEGRWYGHREWHSEAEAAACFVIWKRSTLFGAWIEFWISALGSQEGERFVPPVTRSSGKRVCVMDVWYEAYRLRRFDRDWNRAARVCLYQSIFFFGAEGLSVATASLWGERQEESELSFCQSPESGRMPAT